MDYAARKHRHDSAIAILRTTLALVAPEITVKSSTEAEQLGQLDKLVPIQAASLPDIWLYRATDRAWCGVDVKTTSRNTVAIAIQQVLCQTIYSAFGSMAYAVYNELTRQWSVCQLPLKASNVVMHIPPGAKVKFQDTIDTFKAFCPNVKAMDVSRPFGGSGHPYIVFQPADWVDQTTAAYKLAQMLEPIKR